jgi:small subunit ribosomal protein S16
MSVRISLARGGHKKHAMYRIVVQHSEAARDGRFLEAIGTYDPNVKADGFKVELNRVDHWVSKGARPSSTVGQLIKKYRQAQVTA